MKIEKDTVVTVTARIHDAKGKLLDDGKTARAYLHGSHWRTRKRASPPRSRCSPGWPLASATNPSSPASPNRSFRPV
jgi:hypothetical protein